MEFLKKGKEGTISARHSRPFWTRKKVIVKGFTLKLKASLFKAGMIIEKLIKSVSNIFLKVWETTL